MRNIKTFEGFFDFLKKDFGLSQKIKNAYLVDICKKFKIENYKINSDGTVDVNGDLTINMYGDSKSVKSTKDNNRVIINFNKITGDVYLDINDNIISGGRMPFTFNEVGGNFYANHNRLESLEGSPKIVGGCFDVRFNRLDNLNGGPSTVGGYFSVSDNSLSTLEGCPKYIGGNFDISSNSLKSLVGMTPNIGGELDFNDNEVTSLDGISDCKITNDGIDRNPIYLVLYILFCYGKADSVEDISPYIDLFKSFDPIHPTDNRYPGHPNNKYPILYLDRLQEFYNSVLDEDIDLKKEIEELKCDMPFHRDHPIRYYLEDHYTIKY